MTNEEREALANGHTAVNEAGGPGANSHDERRRAEVERRRVEEERREGERRALADTMERDFIEGYGREIDDAARTAPHPDKVRYDNPRYRRGNRGRWFRRRQRAKRGIYLGKYRDRRGRDWHLRADGVQPRGTLIVGPPGIGKSASYFIPTLLTFEESVFAYDPKGELFMTTAGYAAALGHKVLLFAPTQDPARSCHINPFDNIRWGTRHEEADVQNVVKLILDPKDKAAEGAEAHWIVTGSILLECVIIWLHYNDPKNCNLKGCYDYLTDPRWLNLDKQNEEDGDAAKKGAQKTTAVDEALKHMLKVPHAPSGSVHDALQNGWVDAQDNPSPYHPYVVHSAIEIQGKAPNEKSGVVSTTTRFLHPFRDGILAELTSYSDVLFDDLMNHEVPVRLYFWIPPSDVQRLRVVVSLFLQLLVRAHTGDNALEYRNGVPFYRYRHRLLLAVDEYAQMGKQEQFVLALSVMRSYGLWPMLGVQSPSQLFDILGPRQSLTPMMFYKIFLKPNDIEDAKWIAEHVGYTTKREEKVSYSGNRFGVLTHKSVSIDYSRDMLLAPDTLISMPQSAAIIIAGSVDPDQWDNPIWAGRLFWEDVPELRRRSGNAEKGGKYPAPTRSDVIIHGPPKKQSKHVADLMAAAQSTGDREKVGVGASAAENDAPSQPAANATTPASVVQDAERIVADAENASAGTARSEQTPNDETSSDEMVLEDGAASSPDASAPVTDAMKQFLALAGVSTSTSDDEMRPSDALEGETVDDRPDDEDEYTYGYDDDSSMYHDPAEEDNE